MVLIKVDERKILALWKSFSRMMVSALVQKIKYATDVCIVAIMLGASDALYGGIGADDEFLRSCKDFLESLCRLRGALSLGRRQSRMRVEMLGLFPRSIMRVFQ